MKLSIANRSLAPRISALLMGIAALGIGGCSSDNAVTPDPNAGKKAAVMLLNVNPGFPLPAVFYDGSTLIANVVYGSPSQQAVQIGSRTINVKGTDGTQLASANVQIDSMHTSWAIHTGSTNASEVMSISTLKDTAMMRTALNAGSALVRFINASKTAAKVGSNDAPVALRIGNSLGSKVADNSKYKDVSSYTAVDTTTKKLVVTRATNSDTLAVNQLTVNLVAGKTYSVVLFGSADPAAVDPNRLNAIIVTEP